jgi:hypothetical protein
MQIWLDSALDTRLRSATSWQAGWCRCRDTATRIKGAPGLRLWLRRADAAVRYHRQIQFVSVIRVRLFNMGRYRSAAPKGDGGAWFIATRAQSKFDGSYVFPDTNGPAVLRDDFA